MNRQHTRQKAGGRGMDAIPIWRDSQSLLVQVELAVRGFPRYHKYTLGSDLRRQAMMICRCLVRALNADRAERAPHVQRLVEAVDDIKFQIQVGKELRAFRDFQQFQAVSEQAVCVGRQSGRPRPRTAARGARELLGPFPPCG